MIVTKELPGERWLKLLTQADCRVEVSKHPEVITSKDTIKKLIGSQCDGVLGQLTEVCPQKIQLVYRLSRLVTSMS